MEWIVYAFKISYLGRRNALQKELARRKTLNDMSDSVGGHVGGDL